MMGDDVGKIYDLLRDMQGDITDIKVKVEGVSVAFVEHRKGCIERHLEQDQRCSSHHAHDGEIPRAIFTGLASKLVWAVIICAIAGAQFLFFRSELSALKSPVSSTQPRVIR